MRSINSIHRTEKVNLGGIFVDQAFPLETKDAIDPFLLLHHWASKFPGGQHQKEVGVGPHPHRGFSPVTIIYKGSVHHRDSLGNDSVIGEGGVQWMFAGKGITHSERPSKTLSEQGGDFEIIQLWVNAKSINKMKSAQYYPLNSEDIPRIGNKDSNNRFSLISGIYNGIKGAINVNEDLLLMDIEFIEAGENIFEIPEKYNCVIYMLEGSVVLNEKSIDQPKSLIHYNNDGGKIAIKSVGGSRLLLMAGMPLNEKVVSYGPFVMNTTTDILKAIKDAQIGKMGVLIEEFH